MSLDLRPLFVIAYVGLRNTYPHKRTQNHTPHPPSFMPNAPLIPLSQSFILLTSLLHYISPILSVSVSMSLCLSCYFSLLLMQLSWLSFSLSAAFHDLIYNGISPVVFTSHMRSKSNAWAIPR